MFTYPKPLIHHSVYIIYVEKIFLKNSYCETDQEYGATRVSINSRLVTASRKLEAHGPLWAGLQG